MPFGPKAVVKKAQIVIMTVIFLCVPLCSQLDLFEQNLCFHMGHIHVLACVYACLLRSNFFIQGVKFCSQLSVTIYHLLTQIVSFSLFMFGTCRLANHCRFRKRSSLADKSFSANGILYRCNYGSFGVRTCFLAPIVNPPFYLCFYFSAVCGCVDEISVS